VVNTTWVETDAVPLKKALRIFTEVLHEDDVLLNQLHINVDPTDTAPQHPSLWLHNTHDTFILLYWRVHWIHQNHWPIHQVHCQTWEREQTSFQKSMHAHSGWRIHQANAIQEVYTHTDQYLNFKSNHPLTHKGSVISRLANRAQQYVTTPVHVYNAMRANDYSVFGGAFVVHR